MAMDEMSFVVTTLERINARLDKHDDKLDLIVQVMQQLVKVDTETRELRESLARNYKRLEAVEHNQNTDGCQAHKNFIKIRDEQLKKYDTLVESCEEKHDEFDARLKAIEDLPKKRIEVAIVEVIKWATIIILGIVGIKIGVTK